MFDFIESLKIKRADLNPESAQIYSENNQLKKRCNVS